MAEFVDRQIFLKYEADVNAETNGERTPLHVAVLGENREVVKVHDPHLVRSSFRLDVLQLLLKEGAYLNAVDTDGNTPLHIAAIVGASKIAKVS